MFYEITPNWTGLYSYYLGAFVQCFVSISFQVLFSFGDKFRGIVRTLSKIYELFVKIVNSRKLLKTFTKKASP